MRLRTPKKALTSPLTPRIKYVPFIPKTAENRAMDPTIKQKTIMILTSASDMNGSGVGFLVAF